MRITVFSTACVLIVSLLAGPTLLQAADKPKQGQATVRLGGDLTGDELAKLLGAQVWKLEVSLPARANA